MGRIGPEKSADKSIEWSGKDTEEMSLEENSETAGGAGGVGMTLTSTAEESERSGAEDVPGGTVSGGGATLDATFEDADAERSGSRHRTEKGKGRDFPSGKSSRVRDREGGPKASKLTEKTRGDLQGLGVGVESPRGTDTPVV